MDRSFSPNLVRPNLPLRKPSSSPLAPLTLSPRPRHPTVPGASPVRPSAEPVGDGGINSPAIGNRSAMLGSVPPALTVHYCNYCGHPAKYLCTRCKKRPYCSVSCQREDWQAHRHMCKSVDPEAAKEEPKETTASPGTGDGASLVQLKHSDSSSLQRVYLKDLHMTKTMKGTDIQASVAEFYSPGRFFVLAQSPELLEALQNISTELQKTYRSPSGGTYVPCVGEVCAAQFSCDLNWYRGLVQSLAGDQKMANILYIDFGNEENVPVDRIRPLSADIQPYSPCAMECRIAGVVPVVGSWSGECCIAVKQLLAGKTVTARLVDTLENGHIHAVDILLSMGKQLSTFLLEHGYALEETVNVTPTEQDINGMVSASLQNFRRRSDGKDDNAWAQPPEPLTQAVGDKLSVVVTHFQSPNDFIVQKVENAGLIQDLQLKLRTHCCQVAVPQDFRPAPGTVCCAQFSEDKQWYRAKVLAYSSEERVCVGYLDFGNSEEVDLAHLRPISTSLLGPPMQAVPCGLAGVQPVGDCWSEDCLLALQRRVSNRLLCIEIQGAHAGKALVAMIDEASDPQANIAELLICAGYAAPGPVTTGSDRQADDTPAAAEPHDVSPPLCDPLVWSSTELPRDSQTVALLTSGVKNPGEFYCRINDPADRQRLIELEAQLKQHCEADASPFMATVGEPCCAMLPDDGAWRRAMVKGLCEDKVAVSFVDYGSSMKVEKSHLRSITPELLTLPFQAIRCWLTGVEPLGSEWSSEALLWFQTLVDGEQLSARVLCVTERGCGVELESRGRDVAASLISEQLAKVPGGIVKETHAKTGSATKQPEKVKEDQHHQLHVQASNQTESSLKEIPTEGQRATLSEVPSFPVDWKTVELPLNETFQPYIAAVISPSLFYLLSPTQVDQQKLQEVMMELAAHCSNNLTTLSSVVKSRAAPGAACCAQFSDNNWYRAVVLEVGENEMRVIYADYGNSEKVPSSQVLPIPLHLLQLPFQIARCTLTGKESFPAEWPEEVLQIFQSVLLNDVLATVQSFDGSANVLSLALPTERGGGHLSAFMLDALHAQTKKKPRPATTQEPDTTGSRVPISITAAPDYPQPTSMPETQNGLESITGPVNTTESAKTPEPAAQSLQQKNSASAASANEDQVKKIIEQMEPPCQNHSNTNDPQTSGCCCASLKTKIDHLEQLMQLQLSLIKQLVGQTQ